MAKKRFYDSNMAVRDSAMIKEDMSAPCLLPRNVIDKEWPKAAGYNMGRMQDLFNGVQKQMSEDAADFKREAKGGKY